MTSDRQSRIQEIFHAALDLPETERAGYVNAQCAEDTDLRDAVLALLDHHASAQRVFTPPDGDAHPEERTAVPETIGPYRIERVLGEGGMGTVYLAHQDKPIRRTVALKVVRTGMDSAQVLARFRVEQQALAHLEHPSIARVLDAGSTPDARPYFVMEYVPGPPVTEYCDAKNASFEERIAIFLQVCDAIQHAHRKGIVHRDIKPGNIIVAEHDGRPTPKVIDFGIAKATDDGTLPPLTLTGEGQLVGTVEYMSPEQASAQDADTRTDVYALGSLLYELLVGVPPFDAESLRTRGIDEVIRAIRETDPPRPSARVSTLGGDVAGRAAQRGMEPRSMIRLLRQELDWVVMKALEKDRDRRYESPAELAADLTRYLRNEPVVARPPSVHYRARRFARRHTMGVVVGAIAIVSLVAFSAVTAWQSARVARERDRAEHERLVSDEVAAYLGDIFHGAARAYGFPDSVGLMDAMNMGVERLDDADITPEARVRLLRVFGGGLAGFTRLGEARPVVEDLVRLSLEVHGPDHIETARSRFLLLNLYKQLGEWERAVEAGEAALAVFEAELGPDHEETLRCTWYLAGALSKLGRDSDALVYYDRLESAYRRTLGDGHARLGMLYNEMTFALLGLHEYERAEESARRSVEIMEAAYGAESPMLMLSLDALARVMTRTHRNDEALALLERSEAIAEATYGAHHPEVKRMRGVRGWIVLERGDAADALELFEDAVDVPDNVPALHTADPLLGMGVAYRELGDLAASRDRLESALAVLRDIHGANDPRTVRVLKELGETEKQAGNTERANTLLRRAAALEAAASDASK